MEEEEEAESNDDEQAPSKAGRIYYVEKVDCSDDSDIVSVVLYLFTSLH